MRSLTARLVLTAVALVAVSTLLVTLFTVFAMQRYLTERLDRQVADTFGAPGSVRDGRPGRSLRNDSGPGFGDPDGDDSLFGRGTGSLIATFPTNGQAAGQLIGDSRSIVALSDGDLAQLREVPVDQRVHEVTLSGEGEYRVIAVAIPGGTRVGGSPTVEIQRTLVALGGFGLLIAAVALALAGLVGTLLVRRQLGPLKQVAATAHDVASIPLATGDIRIEQRVPDELTDEATEVGRVGYALNTLLDHVAASLTIRQRSEEQVRQFVADASHELRTPLATILGYAELAQQHPDDAEATHLALTKVRREGDRMAGLVEDLLLLARLDAGRPLAQDSVDLTRLLVEAVSDARVLAPDHHWRIELDPDDDALQVSGDEQRLHQVITNLLTNARRHTPAGSTVTVHINPSGFSVRDDGPGLPPEMEGRAFERFVRGDAARTRGDDVGAGLGLALVHAIVTAHGGTVNVESRPGDTRFEVAFQ